MDDLNNDFSDLLSPHRNAGAQSMYVESNMDDDFTSNPFADLPGNPSSVWASPAEFEQSARSEEGQSEQQQEEDLQTNGPAAVESSSDAPISRSSSVESQGPQEPPPARPSDSSAGTSSTEPITTADKSDLQSNEPATISRTPTPASTSYSAMVSPTLPSGPEQEPTFEIWSASSSSGPGATASKPSPALENTLLESDTPTSSPAAQRDNASVGSGETVPWSRHPARSETSSWHSEQTANAIHHSSGRTTPASEQEQDTAIQSTSRQDYARPAHLKIASDDATTSFTSGRTSHPSPPEGHRAQPEPVERSHSQAQPVPSLPSPEADRPNYLITVTDPQKIGSDVTGSSHILYTVRSVSSIAPSTTRSVLRRFNDFLWLYDTLCANNPGCIVPPPPEKHALGRFSGDFVEQRRKSLQVFLGKVAAHPMLWNDHDFAMFLTSDTFALDIRHRPAPAPATATTPSFSFSGFLSSGPRFVEPSEFIASKQATLSALEPSLRTLTASLQSASKARATVVASVLELSEAVAALEECGLSTPAKRALSSLKELHDQLGAVQKQLSQTAEADLVAMFDSWVRLASTSVKHALNARLKLWQTWQKHLASLRSLERKKESGGDTWQAEHHDVGLRCEQARREFEDSTKLVGAELVRFEVEKGEDFRLALASYIEALYKAQSEIVAAWEKYHKIVVDNAGNNSTPGTPTQPHHAPAQEEEDEGADGPGTQDS